MTEQGTPNGTIRNTMSYTLGEAAKATGKSKTTIKRALEKGRISAKKDGKGQWEIDPAELHRVYKPVTDGTVTGNGTQKAEDYRVLQAENEAMRKQMDLLERMNDDLREDRNKWRQQATALLTHEQEKPPVKVGWFDRLLGRA